MRENYKKEDEENRKMFIQGKLISSLLFGLYCLYIPPFDLKFNKSICIDLRKSKRVRERNERRSIAYEN